MALNKLRDAALMFIGSLTGGAGMIILIIGSLTVAFPWNVTCFIIGAVLFWGGAKLFLKGFDSTARSAG